LLGAGGAARGIYNGLKSSGYLNIDIANRTFEKAEKIKQTNLVGRTKILTLEEAESKLDQYDIIIQSTSVGMMPKTNEQIINLDILQQTTIISDIVYLSISMHYLKDVKKSRANIQKGHIIMLYQAELGFNIWTNQQIKMNDMDLKLQNKLEG